MLTQTKAGRTFDYSHAVGRAAVSGLGFSFPVDLAVGSGDVVYVLNRGYEGTWGSRVSKITSGTTPGDEEFCAEFGRYGEGDGHFTWPAGIAVDAQGKVFVADEWLNRISIFDADGAFLYKWGEAGAEPGRLGGPSGIAFDPEGNLWVVDSRNCRVQRFTPNGKLLSGIGEPGSGPGQFNQPWGLAVDGEGYVYVADHKNHRVQKFSPNGRLAAQFGGPGNGPGCLTRPTDVAVDPDGDVYVCDWSQNSQYPGQVHIYAADGSYLLTLTGNAIELSKWARMTVDANLDVLKARRRARSLEPEWRFAMPTAVVFDAAKSRLLVMDTQRSRIQIYNKANGYLEPQFNL